MEAKTTELAKREASLKRHLNGIPADDGPDHHEIARTLAALAAIPAEVSRAVAAAQALRGAITGEAEAEKHHARALHALESARDRVTRLQTLEPPLSEAVDSAGELLAQAKRWYEKCSDLWDRIRSTEDVLAGARAEDGRGQRTARHRAT